MKIVFFKHNDNILALKLSKIDRWEIKARGKLINY